jgi:hypothetical protein
MGAQAPICITPNAYSCACAYNNEMKWIAQTWMHWLTAAAVMLTSLAPMAAHVSPVPADTGSLKMAVCAPSGASIDLWVDLGLPEAHQTQTGCPYCLVQDSYVPSIDRGLQFAAPESVSKIPSAFHATALPLIAWMQLPARAPPFLS